MDVKELKKLSLASERLLWLSRMAYILTERSRWPCGKTCTKHIFAQDRAGSPSLQTSVHLAVTSGEKLFCCSMSDSVAGDDTGEMVGSGRIAVQC